MRLSDRIWLRIYRLFHLDLLSRSAGCYVGWGLIKRGPHLIKETSEIVCVYIVSLLFVLVESLHSPDLSGHASSDHLYKSEVVDSVEYCELHDLKYRIVFEASY